LFTEDEKKEITKFSLDKSYEDFELYAYAELGKHFSTDGRFSAMWVDTNPQKVEEEVNDDIYKKTLKKLNKNK
jgi:hypothetical protein